MMFQFLPVDLFSLLSLHLQLLCSAFVLCLSHSLKAFFFWFSRPFRASSDPGFVAREAFNLSTSYDNILIEPHRDAVSKNVNVISM